MATSLTRNLKLRINSNLTADSKYNLERLDLLGSTFLTDSTNTLTIRSQIGIVLEPNSADVDGDGTGGTVSVGTASHILDTISLYATNVNLPASLGLLDQGTSGSKYLRVAYDSTLTGLVDTVADRTLTWDLQGADRSVILGGNLSTTGGNLALTLTGNSALTLPTSGTLATLADVAALIPSQTGNAGLFLQTDGTNLLWASPGGGGGGAVNSYATNWITADGLTKVVTHSLGSINVEVSVIDIDDNSVIGVDSIVATDANTVTLTASEAPNTTWRIVIHV